MFGPTLSDVPPDPIWTVPYPPPGKVLVDAAFMAAVRELRTAPDQAAVFAIHRKILAMLPKETADGQ